MSDDTSAAKTTRYGRYIEEVSEDIGETIQQYGCQPILFVGSGLSKRYVGTPSWDELLSSLANLCPIIEKGLGYYKQAFKTAPKIGEEFARIYQEWAWGSGNNEFPKDLFSEDASSQIYLKYKIADIISAITNQIPSLPKNEKYINELNSLKKIKPHSIITTNYDQMLELIFPELEPIIGQQALKAQSLAVSEIFKIHGCVSDVSSIIVTESDYAAFTKKKKFLSAKLLTFFNEHPLLFIGYGASDPNIRSILSDIDEALPEKGGVVPNVYILQWNENLTGDSSPPKDKLLPTEEDRTVRVKLIEANDFTWVFDAFGANPTINNVSPKLLRALAARSYHLIRHDIPRMPANIDFQTLNSSVSNSNSFAKLFGIAAIDDYSVSSITHPLSATELGIQLGGTSWHKANTLIERLTALYGINIKLSDNRYHRTERVNKTPYHKYSMEALGMLKAFQAGDTVELHMNGAPNARNINDKK